MNEQDYRTSAVNFALSRDHGGPIADVIADAEAILAFIKRESPAAALPTAGEGLGG